MEILMDWKHWLSVAAIAVVAVIILNKVQATADLMGTKGPNG